MKDTVVQKISQFLSATKITIIGGGGIAAVELPRLARELRRHGAEVNFCVTENCLKFIGKDSLQWASEQDVVVNPSGFAEHICTADAIVVAPATTDLIAKARAGICSDGATTLLQSALGAKKTVIFCPTMHASLADSPITQDNKKFLQGLDGVFFIPPRVEEGKDKLPAPEHLALHVAHLINKRKDFKDPARVLVTMGATHVMLDDVRCLTNRSSGKLGFTVAKTFYASGVEVQIFAGNTTFPLPTYDCMQVTAVPNYLEMYQTLSGVNAAEYQGVIHLVAGSDFMPTHVKEGKISSSNNLNLELLPTQKIISLPNLAKINFKAAAKLSADSPQDGVNLATNLLRKNQLHALLWNNPQVLSSVAHEHAGVFVTLEADNPIVHSVSSKQEVAQHFYAAFRNHLRGKDER